MPLIIITEKCRRFEKEKLRERKRAQTGKTLLFTCLFSCLWHDDTHYTSDRPSKICTSIIQSTQFWATCAPAVRRRGGCGWDERDSTHTHIQQMLLNTHTHNWNACFYHRKMDYLNRRPCLKSIYLSKLENKPTVNLRKPSMVRPLEEAPKTEWR